MDDTKVIEELSGAAGELSQTATACHRINDGLTKIFDAFFGSPDNTDTFDASCNTCLHFVREAFDRNKYPSSIYGFPGRCAKFDRATTGWPRGQYCQFENGQCYENRRTGLTPSRLVVIMANKTA